MRPYIFYLLFSVFSLTISCTDNYQLPNTGSQTIIVITGLVTNEAGPYYVKVMESVSKISTGTNIQRGVNDARVTITDNNGNVDELRSFHSFPIDSVLYGSGVIWGTNDSIYYYAYFLNIPDGNGGYERFGIEKDIYDNYKIRNDIREGAYFTTCTRGVPGQTYTLKVEYAGREYTATDYMCYGTEIDSISAEPIGIYINDKPDGTDGFMVPCLYFAEPQDEVNFYMFKQGYFSSTYRYDPVEKAWAEEYFLRPAKNILLDMFSLSGSWPFSVVSDRFMPPYVSRYKMDDGDHERKWYQGTDMGFYQPFSNNPAWDVDMYCISESVYRYYYALSQQYYEDGGAFSPSPVSPPTNFSGGAQGCFSAASVSQYSMDSKSKE